MKTPVRKKKSPRFISKVEFLRMQVASAETIWKEAKEHLNRARKRRKLAKLLAKRAKRDAKQAKTRFTEARELLTEAEARAVPLTARTSRRKTAKPRAAAPRTKQAASGQKARKPVRLIRAPKIAEPTPPPPASVVPEAVIREANDRVSQAPPINPGQG